MKIFHKATAALGVVAATIVGGAAVALAEPPTPAEQVGSMATTAVGDLTPIILAVGAALVGVAVIRFGVRWVLGAISNGGRG